MRVKIKIHCAITDFPVNNIEFDTNEGMEKLKDSIKTQVGFWIGEVFLGEEILKNSIILIEKM